MNKKRYEQVNKYNYYCTKLYNITLILLHFFLFIITQVVKSCALISDFEKFLYGDKTIVGEGGINLSGGQKARINLAR